jgi:dTDP-glucose 4,6-dehydratase
MRVLITGAAGFLGSHLADFLLAEGNAVIGVDNLSTGSLENLKHLKGETRFEFREHDICVPFDAGPVDYVFNYDSPASPVYYARLGVETLEVGSACTTNPLNIAKSYNAKILNASTSE